MFMAQTNIKKTNRRSVQHSLKQINIQTQSHSIIEFLRSHKRVVKRNRRLKEKISLLKVKEIRENEKICFLLDFKEDK